MRREDRVGPQRRRPQALQDAAFAVDRNDRDERQHDAGDGEQAGEDRQVGRDEARHAWRVRQSRSPDAAHDHEGDDRDGDAADRAERLAQEDLDLEPGEAPQAAQHQGPQLRMAWPVSSRKTSSSVGSSVRKSSTAMRCSARQWITLCHQVGAAAADCDDLTVPRDGRDARDGAEPGLGERIAGRDDDRAIGAMTGDEIGRCSDVHDAAVIDDRDPIAEALRLLHEVGRQEHRLAAIADAAHEIPDGPPRLRVETGRQLVEEHELGIVDQGERDEQTLLLPARQRHEPGVALRGQAQLIEEAVAVHGRAIEGGPEVHRLPHLDALLELRFLQLDADPLLQRHGVAARVEPEDGNRAAVGRAQAFDALHGGGLAGAVGADQAEDLARLDVEGDVVDGHGTPVGLADTGDVNGGLGHVARPFCHAPTRRPGACPRPRRDGRGRVDATRRNCCFRNAGGRS